MTEQDINRGNREYAIERYQAALKNEYISEWLGAACDDCLKEMFNLKSVPIPNVDDNGDPGECAYCHKKVNLRTESAWVLKVLASEGGRERHHSGSESKINKTNTNIKGIEEAMAERRAWMDERIAEARAKGNKEEFDFEKYCLLMGEGGEWLKAANAKWLKAVKEEEIGFWERYTRETYYLGELLCDEARELWRQATSIEQFVELMNVQADYEDYHQYDN